MEKILFNEGWKIAETEGWLSDVADYKPVKVPHDALISKPASNDCVFKGANAYMNGGLFEYKNDFDAPLPWIGKKILIEFDGTMVNTEVIINRNFVTFHPNGYTPYFVDITPYLLYGKSNRLIVRTDSQLKSSRWYTGCGLYRDVHLRIGNKTHIRPWSLHLTTKEISHSEAFLTGELEIEDINQELKVEIILFYGELEIVKTKVNGLKKTFFNLNVQNPLLWSPDTPYLYRVECKIYQDDKVVDSEEALYGIRTLKCTAKNGLLLNGKTLKLRGGCLHHTNGVMGAVSTLAIEKKKVMLLKKVGFNAIRTAHNPPSTAFLNACDEIGMLVISEFFDVWKEPKCVHDYHMFFDNYWEEDVTATIMRDYNHPSIIMWSIGNEISELGGTSHGFEIARMLAKKSRELDRTRPITSGLILLPDLTGAETAEEIEAALNAFYPARKKNATLTEPIDNIAKNTFSPIFSDEQDYWGDTTKPFIDSLDVAGYNYMSERYEFDGNKFPERIIVGSETFPGRIYEYWDLVNRYPNIIGDFCWTAQDYLGESGIGLNYIGKAWQAKGSYPCRVSGSGDFDIIGNRRPLSYYREIVWGMTRKPYVVVKSPALNGKYIGKGMWGWDEVHPNWTYPGYENQETNVHVYAVADRVKLLLNGKLVGECPVLEHIAKFKMNYTPGTLEAIAYIHEVEVGRTILKTAEELSTYRLEIEQGLDIDDNSFRYIRINAVDQYGEEVYECEEKIYAETSSMEIVALANANPFIEQSYCLAEVNLFHGKALLIVRKNSKKTEKITIRDTQNRNVSIFI